MDPCVCVCVFYVLWWFVQDWFMSGLFSSHHDACPLYCATIHWSCGVCLCVMHGQFVLFCVVLGKFLCCPSLVFFFVVKDCWVCFGFAWYVLLFLGVCYGLCSICIMFSVLDQCVDDWCLYAIPFVCLWLVVSSDPIWSSGIRDSGLLLFCIVL